MDAADDRDRIAQLESTLDEVKSRLRRLEDRLSGGALAASNTKGQTKRVRLSDDGESLEVE